MKKLNYLLVMPRLVQNPGDGYSFPLGLAYISASMKQAGFQVTTLNLNHCDGDVAAILQAEIERNHIDVVATGGLSFQYATVRSVIEAAKRIHRGVITIVGGGIISGDPEPAMEALEYADYGVAGEGEITICELCRVLESGGDPAGVDGIIYRREGRYMPTRPRKEIEDIDALPWPDYEGFDITRYLELPPPGISGMNRKNTMFLLTSRSCPFSCSFCFHTTGRKYRQRSLDNVFAELDYLVSRYDIRFLCVADELFARKLERVKEFCERIRKYNIRWWAQFRVDDVTPELLEILKAGGCEVMSFGLESADNRVLKSMRKGTTVEQIERTLKLVYDSGISLEGAFIFGDTAETGETARNTLKWWREHAEYKISLNLITVFPGCYLYKYACENGIIRDRAQFLKDGCPQVNVSKLTASECSELALISMESSMGLTKPLASVKLTSVDPSTGRMALAGVCTACGELNHWENIKLFAVGFLPCRACGQRYNIPLPAELRRNVEDNFAALLGTYGKLAVWGVNYHSADLFRHSSVLRDANVYPVDISEAKRKLDLYGKQIYPPEVIDAEEIRAVVVMVPVYLTQIAARIAERHQGVERVIDLCTLAGPAGQPAPVWGGAPPLTVEEGAWISGR